MENGEASHFAVIPEHFASLRMQNARKLLNHLNKTFGTLPFCPRWLVREDGGSFAVNGNNGQQKLYHGAEESGGPGRGAGVRAALRYKGKLCLAVGAHTDSEVELEGGVLDGN